MVLDAELRQGDVFWIGSSLWSSITKHRHVISSNQELDSAILLLPITTWDDGKDDSCIITKQDYAPLTHDSCIDYRYGKIQPTETIRNKLADGTITKCPPVSEEVLSRILEGAKESPFLPFDCLDMLSKQDLID